MRRNERKKSDDVQCKFTKTYENSMWNYFDVLTQLLGAKVNQSWKQHLKSAAFEML